MKVPQLARYNGTVEKAYNFVKENINEFPINPFELISKFKWGLLTYEQMALKNNCTIDDICKCLGTDGYSIYNGNNYTIAYNNKICSHGRINFTLAHEIGHIILNHHKDFEVTEIIKDNFSKEEYKILENEANCFARNILAPSPLVQTLGITEYYLKLKDFFNLSFMASNTRRNFFKNDLYYLTDEQVRDMQALYKRYNVCKICSSNYLNIDTSYCPLCGSNKLILGDVFIMKEYKGININELHECPRCENYDLQLNDNYCKICGLKLKNVCASCGMELDSSARYCTQCGNVTTYFSSGILLDWKVAKDVEHKSNNTDSSIYDELPF